MWAMRNHEDKQRSKKRAGLRTCLNWTLLNLSFRISFIRSSTIKKLLDRSSTIVTLAPASTKTTEVWLPALCACFARLSKPVDTYVLAAEAHILLLKAEHIKSLPAGERVQAMYFGEMRKVALNFSIL
jgi:hypothetical protein